MKIMPVVLSLLVVLATQSACVSTRQVQEGLILVEQSKELPSENSVDAEADEKNEIEDSSGKDERIQQ